MSHSLRLQSWGMAFFVWSYNCSFLLPALELLFRFSFVSQTVGNTSFYSMPIVFNSYIFVTERKNSDQEISDSINNFAVHYPQISQQKSENPGYFLLRNAIAILFALKQHRKSNAIIFFFFLISYVCITYLSFRSQWDLENPLNDLKVCSQKHFFLLSH